MDYVKLLGRRKPQDEPTQTTPAGYPIPTPSRGDVMRDLEKIAKPKPSSEGGAED